MTTVKLHVVRIVPDSAIARKARHSAIDALPIWEDLNKIAVYTKQHGVPPYEGAVEIDLDSLKDHLRNDEGKPLKRGKESLLATLRAWVKRNQLESALKVVARGNKIYLQRIDAKSQPRKRAAR